MAIQFHCPGCSNQLQVPDESAGKQARCPVCGRVMDVPNVEQPEVVSAEEVPSYGEAPLQPSGTYANSTAEAGSGSYLPGFSMPQPDPYFVPPLSPRRFDMGHVWSDTWEIYKRNFWMLMGAVVLMLVMNFGLGIAQGVIEELAEVSPGPAGHVANFFAAIASSIFQAWIAIGLFIFLINTITNRHPNISDLFSGGRYLLRYIGGSILFAAGIFAIVFIFAIPNVAIFVAGGNRFGPNQMQIDPTFWLVAIPIIGVGLFCVAFYSLTFVLWPLLIIDRNLGVIEAFSTSAQLMRGNRFNYFIIQFATAIIVIALGMMTCCIGFFVTLPFLYLMMVVLYYHIAGLPVARGYVGH